MKQTTIGHGLLRVGAASLLLILAAPTMAADKAPNILVIWGDDIGPWNISHNSRGMPGQPKP